jgi:hypothetical protein
LHGVMHVCSMSYMTNSSDTYRDNRPQRCGSLSAALVTAKIEIDSLVNCWTELDPGAANMLRETARKIAAALASDEKMQTEDLARHGVTS